MKAGYNGCDYCTGPGETSRGFQAAYRRGYYAGSAGHGYSNPYPDKRGGANNHVVTFSRAWARFYRDGYKAGVQHRESHAARLAEAISLLERGLPK